MTPLRQRMLEDMQMRNLSRGKKRKRLLQMDPKSAREPVWEPAKSNAFRSE
jgi:hypothetical protein